MPRKNTNARRRNTKGLKARRTRGEGRPVKVKEQPRVALGDLILPDGQCTFMGRRPKARFATKDKADAALVQAQQQRARLGSGHVEKRVYACPDGGCEGYHLTSRDEFDEKAWKQRRKVNA